MRQRIKQRLRREMLAAFPRCYACNCELTEEPDQPNSAHLVRKCLACPKHVKAVRKLGQFGDDKAVLVLTEKAIEFLDKYHNRQVWFVDGIEYDCEKRAERAAQSLAKALGCRVDILSGRDHKSCKLVEIVRPGDDANIRDESFHRDRRRRIEFSRQ
ncbi:hypothetical protein [Schlesneria sp. DSM 10557]|uniref:hypothetical protein n=1 Tax=Schlesneria sp. DSM 10557 TaxID=3044399 RepID=UPI0035A0CBBC